MSALAAANVTVAIVEKDATPGKPQRRVIADLTFGNGALTYPSGGVPMPTIAQFGFSKVLNLVNVEQPYANGFIYKFDRTNHKLLIFTMGVVTGSTAVDDATTGALVEDSASAETTLRAMGVAIDTTVDMGGLIQLPTTIAPAAATVRLELVGV